jgi:hypothetical protein
MQRNSNGPSVRLPSIPFSTSPGLGWRLHMSRIAAEILPTPAPLCRTARPGIVNILAA